ncbi:hypothetical protein CDO73_24745 [Saccharibacillus sp. O23]|nr:hypothetical protein [Saccharibacillus sp. O23]OWA37984.1 hypothetical protein B9G55_07350 [Saccharibacillus sp. O16]OWR26807.1 hypothetical protein CDO73_24745 [Saccharibacillus sp. O23]
MVVKTTTITVQEKLVPVYIDAENTQPAQKMLRLLTSALDNKLTNGKRALKNCISSLISIEIVGSEAILHSYRESDTLALSLY